MEYKVTKWQAYLAHVDRTQQEDELFVLAYEQQSISYFERAYTKFNRVRREREIAEWKIAHPAPEEF